MRSLAAPKRWPLSVKVPLAVAALMILVGAVLSERVLAGLAETQKVHLMDLAQSYLDGLSSALAPSILRDDTWAMFDAIERAESLNKGVRSIETVVTDTEGAVIAASDPRRHRLGSIPANVSQAPFTFIPGGNEAEATRQISYPGRTIAIIHARFDTRQLAAQRRDVLRSLIITNGTLTILLAGAGWLLVYRMMRPVRILTHHLGSAERQIPASIPARVIAQQGGEFAQSFRAYNAMATWLAERESLRLRLAEEERLASLGRLASTLAHEINNPLAGLFNVLATLRSHGEEPLQRQRSIDLLDRGLRGIRDVVQAALTLHRSDAVRALAPCDIEDLGLLVGPEAARRNVLLRIDATLPAAIDLPSGPIRQALLNLVLNAVAASPPGSQVVLSARCDTASFTASVSDEGHGIAEREAAILTGRSSTSILELGSGVGLWATRHLIDDLGGSIGVRRADPHGTIVDVSIPLHAPVPQHASKEMFDVA
ncbi:sensor histidine kinase [Consotaella salsifontis]|uniref:histidine kinase n=1 Tax=Consotaella salsifontis TaxID=1365950 RepID=A0A1T4SEK2_9HYPH|nr:HAMP domain-containing sensor histidine kinase [Consotaella salsifontis]SKA26576.1 Signal transduction histidine kinase [Consotaella salsifontis]